MKADRYGTHTEKSRWLVGWITPTQRRDLPEHGSCKTCKSFSPPREGKGEFCEMHGFSTRKGARCWYYDVRMPAWNALSTPKRAR